MWKHTILVTNPHTQNIKLAANWSILSRNPFIDAMSGIWCRLVKTKYRRDYELQFQASNTWLSLCDNGHHWLFTGIIFDEIWSIDSTGPSTTPNHSFFMKSLQLALCPKCGNFACLRIHWTRNRPHGWTKFGSKTSDLPGSFSKTHRAKRSRLRRTSGFSSFTSYILYDFKLGSWHKMRSVVS